MRQGLGVEEPVGWYYPLTASHLSSHRAQRLCLTRNPTSLYERFLSIQFHAPSKKKNNISTEHESQKIHNPPPSSHAHLSKHLHPHFILLFYFTCFFFSLPLLRPLQLGRLLGLLLAAGDLGLDADAAKHEADAEPLHVGEAVAKGHDAEDHGEHLARDGDGDEQDRGERR